MANSVATRNWSLRMPAGTLTEWLFTFTTNAPGGSTPFSIAASTWEYVVRTSATDLSTPLVSVTTTPSAAGSLTVTSTATLSTVLLALNPAATAALAPGTYWHSLWQNPNTSTAFTWVTGNLLIDGNPQP